MPITKWDRWGFFHEAATHLSVEIREVFNLVYYHGWSHVEVGNLLHVSERTVLRK